MPWASKVRRMSIVAFAGGGDGPRAGAGAGGGAGVKEEDGDGDDGEEGDGVNAEASTEAILVASQVLVIESGKSAESRTKTSEGERRPSVRALVRSSVLRRGPSELALPVVVSFL